MHVGAGQSRSVADACHISRDSDRTYMEQKRAFAHHCGNAGQLRKGQKRIAYPGIDLGSSRNAKRY